MLLVVVSFFTPLESHRCYHTYLCLQEVFVKEGVTDGATRTGRTQITESEEKANWDRRSKLNKSTEKIVCDSFRR